MRKFKKKSKKEAKGSLELPGTVETYNSELDKAIHDTWLARSEMARANDAEEVVEGRLVMEMKKAGKTIVVKFIDGERFVAYLVIGEEKLKFKK